MKYHWMHGMKEIISSVNLCVEWIINCWIFRLRCWIPWKLDIDTRIPRSTSSNELMSNVPLVKVPNDRNMATQLILMKEKRDLPFVIVLIRMDDDVQIHSWDPFSVSNVVRQLLFRTKRAIKIVIPWSVNHDFRMNIYRQNNYCWKRELF